MKVNEQQLASFERMMRDFAAKNGLHMEFEVDGSYSNKVKVAFSKGYSRWPKTYYVDWGKVRSLTEAATPIFADLTLAFNLQGRSYMHVPEIKDVMFRYPATIVFWEDGTKTVVKCQDDDIFTEEMGLAMAICKKAFGNTGKYNDVFRKHVRIWGRLSEQHYPNVVIPDDDMAMKPIPEAVTELVEKELEGQAE